MIILPIDAEAYHAIILNRSAFRYYLDSQIALYPELFPRNINQGYCFCGWVKSSQKMTIIRRRIRLKNLNEEYSLHPCFILPYLRANTIAASKGLLLRKYNTPYHVISQVLGNNAMFWYRLELSLSFNNIVGTTIKKKEQLPQHILCDEHHDKLAKEKVYVCTTVAKNCFLGASVTSSISHTELQIAYRKFKEELQQVAPEHNPLTINIDGFKSTRKTMESLFEESTIIVCFLHGVLKIQNAATKKDEDATNIILNKVWNLYKAANKRSFSAHMRHLKEWTTFHLEDGKLQKAILKLCQKKMDYAKYYDFKNAQRTSNMLDRLMRFQDRRLYASGHFHGTLKSADSMMRAHALLVNFCPFNAETIKAKHGTMSPFEQLNGFRYRDNWLENLLVASSLNGKRQML